MFQKMRMESSTAITFLSILLLLLACSSFSPCVQGLLSTTRATTTRRPLQVPCLHPALPSSRLGHLLATIESESDMQQGQSQYDNDVDEDIDSDNESITLININSRDKRNVSGSSGASKKNPAMSDTAFLRKRTSHLLHVTDPDYFNNKDDDTGSDNDNNNSQFQRSLSRNMKVDLKTFHFLLDAWAFSAEPDAVEQASSLLARMEQLSTSTSLSDAAASSHIHNIRPDVRSYTKLINAIARSGHATAGQEAEEILCKMEHLYSTQRNPAARPNTYTYTAAVEAHLHSNQGPASALAAEKLVRDMMHKYHASNGRDESICPTARAFQAAMSAHAKSGIPGSAAMAEALFDEMEAFYESLLLKQNSNVAVSPKIIAQVMPNAYHLNTLITAWANCGEEGSAQCAEEVLERMEYLYKNGAGNVEAKPTTVSYNSVIDAWAKSGEDDAAQRAEQVLQHMEELYSTGENIHAKPNIKTFNSVLNAWAKSSRAQQPNAADKAQELLDRMERLYKQQQQQQGGSDNNNSADIIRPDVHSFCTVINAWARSASSNKAERALNLYKEMKNLYKAGNHQHLKPTVVAVNAVMNACAYTPTTSMIHSNRAVEIAHFLLKKELDYKTLSPDQVTYGTFLKVLANQMPDCSSRKQIVEYLFKNCCRDGQVGNLVLQQLQRVVASDEEFQELVHGHVKPDHDGIVRMEDLPNEWTCNVVEGRWKRRQQLTNNINSNINNNSYNNNLNQQGQE